MITETIAKNVVAFVNANSDLKLEFDILYTKTPDVIRCKNDGKVCFIIGDGHKDISKYFVRSVLAPKRHDKGMNWLCNGQAGTNCRELLFWGEETPYLWNYADEDSWLNAVYGDRLNELIERGIVIRRIQA